MFKVIYHGEIYRVYDITEHSYIVSPDEDSVYSELPKEECEVV